jgi:oxygen-dependent protoporphyrinogen oxidase
VGLGDAHRVVVVGGGITGLTAAYRLAGHSNGRPLEVTILEASSRLGGKIRTAELAGMQVEEGADSFVVRKPWAVELARELGLENELVVPERLPAFMLGDGGRLLSFPSRAAFGVPAGAMEAWRWPGLSGRARLRALADLVRPARRSAGDEPLGTLLQRRLGADAAGQVGPLLAGIHAGDPEQLSVAATFPELKGWERDHGSLIRAARRSARNADQAKGALFAAPWTGLSRLVEAVATALEPGRVHVDSPVSAIRPGGEARWEVVVADVVHAADSVVLTTPAFEAARLLRERNPAAAEALDRIGYASTAVVLLVYPPGTASKLPVGTGYIVPERTATVTACTWVSSKWPRPDQAGRAVLRCYVGRAGSQDPLALDDGAMVAAVRREVEQVTPFDTLPEATRVVRWPRAMPQYEVGHLERVAAVDAALAATPGVFVAGSAYRGVGIADCVRQAGEVAQAVHRFVVSKPADGTDDEQEAISWTN